MSNVIAWIAAEAERPKIGTSAGFPRRQHMEEKPPARQLPAHQFPARAETQGLEEQALEQQRRAVEDPGDYDRERRIYRGRTVAMLRRYMRYSIETGRLPSLLGREFFRAKVTAYTVVTFEDRVIFVHDMERCLERLDEFSRQLIGRHILQEHDRWATARLLNCNEKTVRRYAPLALDLLSEILLEVGLLCRLDSIRKNSCQEGESDPITPSDSEDGKYKV